MDGGGSDCIEKGLRNGPKEVIIRSSVKKNRGRFFLVCMFLVLSFQTTKLVVDKTSLRR
jgi:hypothetical protein